MALLTTAWWGDAYTAEPVVPVPGPTAPRRVPFASPLSGLPFVWITARVQDTEHHHVTFHNTIVHGVWKPAGQSPPDVAIDHHVHLWGATDTLQYFLHAEEERRSKPGALPLIPVPCVHQVGLRFRADDHARTPNSFCRRAFTSSQLAPACGSAS